MEEIEAIAAEFDGVEVLGCVIVFTIGEVGMIYEFGEVYYATCVDFYFDFDFNFLSYSWNAFSLGVCA